MEVDLTKDLYRIGTKDGITNSWYARNQFSTCAEGTVNIADVPSVNISLRECAQKHYLVTKDIEEVMAKHRAEVTLARAESQTSYATLNVTIVYRAKTNGICFDNIMLYKFFCFVFLFFLFLTDVMKNYFCLFPCIRFWSTGKQLFVFITTFANRIRRFYTFPKRRQSLYIFTGFCDK